MHDFDRTSLETGYGEYGEYEADEFGFEFEDETESYGESPFSEAEEMELAAELLGVSSEEELDHFIWDKLIKGAGQVLGQIVKSPIGKQLGGIIKGAAKSALPMLGGALGNLVAPGVGGAIGSQFVSGAGSMFGLELEGLSQEDQEFETARQIVRFAGAATNNALEAPPSTPPQQAAQSAAVAAAQQYAPGLLRPNGNQIAPQQQHIAGRCKHNYSGRWIRKGRTIILLEA